MTCAPVWQGLAGGAVTSPAVANGVVYVGSADGFVHAFAAAGCGEAICAPLWSAATPGAPTQVVVASGRVHVLTATGELAAFGLP
jgi:outer membrane protein assembly factor BamB